MHEIIMLIVKENDLANPAVLTIRYVDVLGRSIDQGTKHPGKAIATVETSINGNPG